MLQENTASKSLPPKGETELNDRHGADVSPPLKPRPSALQPEAEPPDWRVKVAQSCPTLCDPMTIQSVEYSRPEYWSLSPLQGVSPTQGYNPGLPHYRQILYQQSQEGSPGWAQT